MSPSLPDLALPQSILDTDLYKLTMQQAVLHHFPDVPATYRFTNRDSSILFSRECFDHFKACISDFSSISLTEAELQWLQKTCPYFTPKYLSYLASYRFKPEQVKIKYVPLADDDLKGLIEIDVAGPWVEAILWDVPMMACLSQSYFRFVDVDWDYEHQHDLAYSKAKALLEADCRFTELGIRRRRSFQAEDIVFQALLQASRDISGTGKFSGTSNPYLAYRHGLSPAGTIAHEWFTGVAALRGYEHANTVALRLWGEFYNNPQTPLIALTDTFTTEVFIEDFVVEPEIANRWNGVRQDSGDPFTFGPRIKNMYQRLGIPHDTKTVIFSDGLTVEKCLEIKKQCAGLGFKDVAFGIGTHLVNDFRCLSTGEKSKALNIVIKLASVSGKPCVKISDEPNKTVGDRQTVEAVKEIYGL